MPTYSYQPVAPVVMLPNVSGRAMPVFIAPQAGECQPGKQIETQPTPPPPQITEDDIKQVQEMFPNVEREVIKTVLEANRRNIQATINTLLQMTDSQ